MAALELFGEKGFKSTTIREICKKADVSLALVNYHFRNKQNLYEEIVIGKISDAFEKNPMSSYITSDMSPEEKLRNAIRLILHRLLGKNGLGLEKSSIQLLARELTSPSSLMDVIFEKHLSHMISLLRSIIIELKGDMPQVEVMRFASSIAGQCLHPLLAKSILTRAGFHLKGTDEEIEQHAYHIYNFSLNGIRGYEV